MAGWVVKASFLHPSPVRPQRLPVHDLKPHLWEKMKQENGWNEVDLRDNRYNQVLHLVSAAYGAEAFYGTDDHTTRYEGVELARNLDKVTSQAWVGHPYFDVIDNSTDFERKVVRMIAAVCNRLNIDAGDRLSLDSKKRKFLVAELPDEVEQAIELQQTECHTELIDEAGIPIENSYPQFQDFIVVHDYLVTPNQRMQARIRRRGQNVDFHIGNSHDPMSQDQVILTTVSMPEKYGPQFFLYGTNDDISNWTYTHTIRRPEINQESPELKMQISVREYELLVAQKDVKRYTVYKKRRCFLWNNQYFQMDIYQEPCHDRCRNLIILETYTTLKGEDLKLPSFLNILREVTKDSYYSMYNLARIEEAGDRRQHKLQQLTNGVAHCEEAAEDDMNHPPGICNGVDPLDSDMLSEAEK